MIGFGHHHLMAMYERLGFVADEGAGVYAYPDRRFETHVIWLDLVHVREADSGHRSAVFSMRNTIVDQLGDTHTGINRCPAEVKSLSMKCHRWLNKRFPFWNGLTLTEMREASTHHPSSRGEAHRSRERRDDP